MSAALAAVEVGRGRSEPDELEVDVPAAGADVPKQPAVAIPVVERGIALQLDRGSDRGEQDERIRRGVAEALDVALRRVDLDEPDPATVGEPERVAVRDSGDAPGFAEPDSGDELDAGPVSAQAASRTAATSASVSRCGIRRSAPRRASARRRARPTTRA